MAGMQLSVAMCTFNRAVYLQEQLNSISRQTRLPDELVVCDDGSTDDTVAICEAYQHKASFPVVIYSNAERLGSPRNFEQAIRLCNGDIIALADQDDIWLPEKLARLDAVLSADATVGAVFSDAEVVDESLQPFGYRLWQCVNFTRRERRRLVDGGATRVLLKHNVVTGATLALRASLRELVLPIPPGWVHDEWIALMISIFSRFALIKEPLVLYRQSPLSQIGVRKKSFSDRIALARRKNIQADRANLERFSSARQYLASGENVPNQKHILNQFDEKIRHLRVRTSLPDRLGDRIIAALKELITLRYNRYSKGLYSFARDIVFKSPGAA